MTIRSPLPAGQPTLGLALVVPHAGAARGFAPCRRVVVRPPLLEAGSEPGNGAHRKTDHDRDQKQLGKIHPPPSTQAD